MTTQYVVLRGGNVLVDTLEIERYIKDSGKKKGYLADVLGISRTSLLKKINGITDFTVKEAYLLSREIGIKNSEIENIFLH